MHVVEITTAGDGLAGPMATMRTWLDHNQIQPSLFDFARLPERQIRFRLLFRETSDAVAFARAFKVEAQLEPAVELAA